MPALTFSQDRIRSNGPTFPKLKLEMSQTARVVCIETGPVYEWVHNLQKPKLGVDGKPKMIWVKKKGSTEQVQDYDMEFIGTPICLGDPDVLEEKGVDPNKCPACKLAVESDFLRPPARRFAIHTLQYETKPGTPNLVTPFSVRCLVWVLSEGRFTQVTQVLSEFGENVDPRKVDLILGPCDNAAFQNYKISAAQQCALTASKENFARGMETYKSNHAEDLSLYCGRKADLRYLRNDLEDIVAAWARTRGEVETVAPDVSDTLDSSLLDSVSVVPQNQVKPRETTIVTESPVIANGSTASDIPDEQAIVDAELTQAIPSAQATSGSYPVKDVPDFDDLLASLKTG